MTTFEEQTLIISVIALVVSVLIPISQFVYKRYIKRLKMNMILFDRLVLLFNERGPYFKFKFSLECRNQSATIKVIKANITRKSNNETVMYEWSMFESISTSWVGENRVDSAEDAHPIKVWEDSLTPFFVSFANCNENTRSILQSINEDRNNAIQELFRNINDSEKKVSVKEFLERFRGTKEYNKLLNSFTEYFFWRDGDYTLTLTIIYNFDKKFLKSFPFTITKEESDRLRENIDKTIIRRFLENNDISPNFSVIYKSIEPSE